MTGGPLSPLPGGCVCVRADRDGRVLGVRGRAPRRCSPGARLPLPILRSPAIQRGESPCGPAPAPGSARPVKEGGFKAKGDAQST